MSIYSFVKTISHPSYMAMGLNYKRIKSHLETIVFIVMQDRIIFKWHSEGSRHTLMGKISGMITEQKHCQQVSK